MSQLTDADNYDTVRRESRVFTKIIICVKVKRACDFFLLLPEKIWSFIIDKTTESNAY